MEWSPRRLLNALVEQRGFAASLRFSILGRRSCVVECHRFEPDWHFQKKPTHPWPSAAEKSSLITIAFTTAALAEGEALGAASVSL